MLGERWVFCDGKLRYIESIKPVPQYGYMYCRDNYLRRFITDGKTWMSCNCLKEGILRMQAKKLNSIEERYKYRQLTLDSEVSFADAIIMYHIVTRACILGILKFVKRNKHIVKEKYTIKELIDISKDEDYGLCFRDFFKWSSR
jgi:hypothetical protein